MGPSLPVRSVDRTVPTWFGDRTEQWFGDQTDGAAMSPNAEQARTLGLAAAGTVLAMIAYTTPLATLASTAVGLGAGPDAQAWILSSMSVGLALALLPAGAVGDDHGRRRMFAAGALVLAAASVLAAL